MALSFTHLNAQPLNLLTPPKLLNVLRIHCKGRCAIFFVHKHVDVRALRWHRYKYLASDSERSVREVWRFGYLGQCRGIAAE